MNDIDYSRELSRCVRCGACKALCPTYLTTLNETMGARGRVAMLGELEGSRLAPTERLADRIFSCMLCGACKNLCPAGINIPELIYGGRDRLKSLFSKGRLIRTALKYSSTRMDAVFPALRIMRKMFYGPLFNAGLLPYIPELAPEPFKNSVSVYKNIKRIGRMAVFAGCSVNYLYPDLGKALLRILISKGYEVVVFKGEVCCGAPLRAAGLEEEAAALAKKNVEHFNRVRAEAVISMCPTCTMFIREQYPSLAGDTITSFMDVNEFLVKYDIASGLELSPAVVTYHDPCHLHYSLGIKNEPRHILKGIKGVEFTEMQDADECCGFAGLFSLHFKNISREIGRKKIDNISRTAADTVVTSCPGCIMQLEGLKKEVGLNIDVRHIVEIVDEAVNAEVK